MKNSFNSLIKPLKILYILSQKPGNTGSGIYIKYITEEALKYNVDLRIIVGITDEEDLAPLSHIKRENIYPVFFKKDIPFIIPGMSDVMPYPSIKFSEFTDEMYQQYCNGFEKIFKKVSKQWLPDIIHSNHLWIVSALAKKYFNNIPVMVSCHGTSLRQRFLAPQIAERIVNDLKNIDIILALTDKQKNEIINWLGMENSKIKVVGSGYAHDIFCKSDNNKFHDKEFFKIAYAGKISFAKGVPYLIDAIKNIDNDLQGKVKLYLAGDYNSAEGERIRNRIISEKNENIIFLGKLEHEELAKLFAKSHLFILPSFFEGLPLVIMESLACGCVAIVSELPDITCWIDKNLLDNEIIRFIPLPKMESVDKPCDNDAENFTKNIKESISYYARKFFKNDFPDVTKFNKFIKEHSFESLFKKIYNIYLQYYIG